METTEIVKSFVNVTPRAYDTDFLRSFLFLEGAHVAQITMFTKEEGKPAVIPEPVTPITRGIFLEIARHTNPAELISEVIRAAIMNQVCQHCMAFEILKHIPENDHDLAQFKDMLERMMELTGGEPEGEET